MLKAVHHRGDGAGYDPVSPEQSAWAAPCPPGLPFRGLRASVAPESSFHLHQTPWLPRSLYDMVSFFSVTVAVIVAFLLQSALKTKPKQAAPTESPPLQE